MPTRDLIVIGGSAGGIEALRRIVALEARWLVRDVSGWVRAEAEVRRLNAELERRRGGTTHGR